MTPKQKKEFRRLAYLEAIGKITKKQLERLNELDKKRRI